MIWYKKKLVFIHIPKCGGTSIENTLNQGEQGYLWGYIEKTNKQLNFKGELQHLNFLGYKNYLENYKSFNYFTVVRNPFDRAISFYKYILIKDKNLKNRLKIDKNISFNEFLKKINDNDEITFKDQSFFLKDENSKINEKIKILKLENLDINFYKLLNEQKIKFNKIRKNNISKKFNLDIKKNYYKNEENIKLVSELYFDDIKNFNYSFDQFLNDQKYILLKNTFKSFYRNYLNIFKP